MSSVFPTTTASQVAQPKQILVEEWRLLETYRGERHIVGRFASTGRYWATPPVVQLDFASGTAIASGGQRFLLVGKPGAAAAAARFISLCAAFDKRLLTTRDVTRELFCNCPRRCVLLGGSTYEDDGKYVWQCWPIYYYAEVTKDASGEYDEPPDRSQ